MKKLLGLLKQYEPSNVRVARYSTSLWYLCVFLECYFCTCTWYNDRSNMYNHVLVHVLGMCMGI